MKHLRLLLMSMVAALLASCGTTKTVPITGRQQSLMVSDDQVLSLSFQEYSDYMKTAKPSTNSTNTAMVKRVGQNIAKAVESYLTQNGMAEEVKTYSWEFNLVQDNQVNAWCMPGGKIVVYEGLLPVTQDEASLAIVMGHEIAHAVARHSAERLSNAYKEQYGAAALSAVLQGAGVSSGWQQLASLAHQYGGALFTSGFSRKQESEADHIGLIFAAMAGYNPEVAVTFWQRMSSATGGGSNSLFADHPSDATRIEQIQGWLPEAKKYYTPPKTTTKKTTTKKSTTKKKK